MPNIPRMTPPTSRTYGWLVLGTLAFILYGSLVPFQVRVRPFSQVLDSFAGAMSSRVHFESRSDAFANVLLGIPLGFSLLAWSCVDRGSRRREFLHVLLFLPVCIAFSTFVEFLQLYVPSRTCAASDVLMQAVGAALGMGAWIGLGQWFTGHARRLWAGPQIGGSAGRMLVVYLVVLAAIQVLPLDLTLSPKDIYKNLRDKVHYIPFSEFRGTHSWADFSGHVSSRIETLGLYLPVGLLAGCLPGRFWQSSANALRILGLGVLLGLVMEGMQVLVMSRSPSNTDVLMGAAGVLAGWTLARRVLSRQLLLTAGIFWSVCLVVVYWHPFEFSSSLSKVEWLLLLPLEMRNPFRALGDLLTKVVLIAPLGVLTARLTRAFPLKQRLALAAGVGFALTVVIEAGQLLLPTRTPSLTDVALGAVGAWCGAAATLRARAQS